MKKPAVPDNEAARLASLRSYRILDSAPEAPYDEIAELAAKICDAPYAMFNLIDVHRQWQKSSFGFGDLLLSPDRDRSICSHTILHDTFMEIPDTAEHEIFEEEVRAGCLPAFRFYAGMPVLSDGGHAIGVLCVFGPQPKTLSPWQRDSLKQLASVISVLLAAKKKEMQAAWLGELLEQTPQELYILDPLDLTYLYANHGALAHLGYTWEELKRMHLLDLYPECADDKIRQALDELRRGDRTTVSLEAVQRRKDNTRYPVEMRLHAAERLGQQALVLMVSDMSERMAREEALAKANAEIRTILESITDAFFALDNEWRFTYVNARAEQLLQRGRGELVGQNVWQEFPAASGDVFEREYRTAMETGQTVGFEAFFAPLDIWFAITAYPHPEGLSVYFRDITRRKQREAQLAQQTEELARAEAAQRQQAAVLQSVLDNIADGVMVADQQGKFLVVNPAASQILHYGALDAPTKQWSKGYGVYLPDGQTLCPPDQLPLVRAMRGERVDNAEMIVRQAHWPEAWISINARPLLDAAGHLQGGVVAFRDITRQKQDEQELRRLFELSEQRGAELAAFIEHVPDAVFFFNNHGVLLANVRALELLGTGRTAELQLCPVQLGKRLNLRFLDGRPVPADRLALLLALQGKVATGERIATRRDTGAEVVVRLMVAPVVRDGAVAGAVAILTDITEQRHGEEALRRTEERLRLIIEGSKDYAIMMLDPDSRIISWNAGAENVLGYAEEDVVGQPVSMLFTEEDVANGVPQREHQEALSTGRAVDDRWHVRKDGSRFFATGSMSPLWDKGQLVGFVKVMRDNTQRKIAEDRTYYLANHDTLTGLPNRVHFSDRLHVAMATADRNGSRVALLLLDLDRFKSVNDTLGHHVGDLLLKDVANRLIGCVRETDTVARLGGDEFVIVQTNVHAREDAAKLAAKVVNELGRPYVLDGQEVHSGTSIGVTFYPDDTGDAIQLLKFADLALYRAKGLGRHNYQLFTQQMQAKVHFRQQLERELRRALERGELELYYQPQIHLRSMKLVAVEALLRWRNKNLQAVALGELLGIAEEAGQMVAIGEWVVNEACRQNKAWQLSGIPPFRVSVNFSARQFSDPNFAAMLDRALNETGLAAEWLELEISESQLAHNNAPLDMLLDTIKKLGIRITTDDFGAGISSFGLLQHLPIDALKIDQKIVQCIAHSRHRSAIASAIVSLANDLGLDVVAEGVETLEQLAFLKARGCTSAQGFLFSPPLPASELARQVRAGSWSEMNPV